MRSAILPSLSTSIVNPALTAGLQAQAFATLTGSLAGPWPMVVIHGSGSPAASKR
jgi:hypothetical protein